MTIKVNHENSEFEAFDSRISLGTFQYNEGKNWFDLGLGLELEVTAEGDVVSGTLFKDQKYEFPKATKTVRL